MPNRSQQHGNQGRRFERQFGQGWNQPVRQRMRDRMENWVGAHFDDEDEEEMGGWGGDIQSRFGQRPRFLPRMQQAYANRVEGQGGEWYPGHFMDQRYGEGGWGGIGQGRLGKRFIENRGYGSEHELGGIGQGRLVRRFLENRGVGGGDWGVGSGVLAQRFIDRFGEDRFNQLLDRELGESDISLRDLMEREQMGDEGFDYGIGSGRFGQMMRNRVGQHLRENWVPGQFIRGPISQALWQHGFTGERLRNLRGPKGYVRSDERIREDVSDHLGMQMDAGDIEVNVRDGEVTLSGLVESRILKFLAEEIAERIAGVKEIVNNLRVLRQEMKSQRGNGGVEARLGESKEESSMSRRTRPTS